jgi:hypothetical protein
MAYHEKVEMRHSYRFRFQGYRLKLILLLSIEILSAAHISCSHNQGKTEKKNREKCVVVPEYNRTMKKVAVSLAQGNTTLELQHELLVRLPEYSEIILLLPESSVQPIKSSLRHAPYGGRTKLVTYKSDIRNGGFFHFLAQGKEKLVREKLNRPLPVQQGTCWIQDLFEVGTCPDETIQLYASVIHVCFWTKDSDTTHNPMSDNDFLYSLSSQGLNVVKLPLAFNGGNILFDEIGGKRVAFCGRDTIIDTHKIYDSFHDSVVPDSAYTGVIKNTFDVNDVIIVGLRDAPQPRLMYHLDQAMIPLSDGVAGITAIVGDYPQNPKALERIREVEQYLDGLRTVLSSLGYKLVPVETSAENVLRYEYYANAVPFIHAVTGKKILLMPVFSFEPSSEDKEIIRRNIARFESLGYTVITVPSTSQTLKGGPHCLINVLE